MWGEILGAGAGIVSSILGGNAESEASERNWQINLMNYYQRAAERNDAQFQAMKASSTAEADKAYNRQDAINSRNYAIEQAEQAKKLAAKDKADQRLGTTDASGNRSYFKEGVGWVSELSPMQQALQERYRREEEATLDNDLPKQRQLFNQNVKRQNDESDTADQMKWKMGQATRRSVNDIEGELNNVTAKGLEEGYGSALEDAMRAALRTGSSNAGLVAADIGRDRSAKLIQSLMSNKQSARLQSEQEYGNDTKQTSDLYNLFASRASADPNIAYNPRNVDGSANSSLNGAMGGASGGGSALLNAFANQGNAGGRTLQYADPTQAAYANQIKTAGMQGGSLDYVQPNNGAANMWGGVGASLSGLGTAFESRNALQDAQTKALSERYKQGTGLF